MLQPSEVWLHAEFTKSISESFRAPPSDFRLELYQKCSDKIIEAFTLKLLLWQKADEKLHNLLWVERFGGLF